MERQMLRLTLVLGLLVTILGGTGVFAVFSDQARGGHNTADSGTRASAADLLIATATADFETDQVSCGSFSDDTTTPQFTVTDLQPTSTPVQSWVCLQNAGAAPLRLEVASSPIRSSDVECTGDEAAIGDATCGNFQTGELAELLFVAVDDVSCASLVADTTHVSALTELATQAVPVRDRTLAPREIACVRFILTYSRFATEEQIQVAQSDRAEWSFVFTGVAS